MGSNIFEIREKKIQVEVGEIRCYFQLSQEIIMMCPMLRLRFEGNA